MDMGTFAIGCYNYELNRDNGKLPKDDIEFQNETGIGPVYNNGRPLTRDEMVERLQEDNRMTDDEIEEYLDKFDEKLTIDILTIIGFQTILKRIFRI